MRDPGSRRGVAVAHAARRHRQRLEQADADPRAQPGRQGRALQVDPMKPTLKAPGSKRSKLKYDKLLSSFAYNLKLRRYGAGQLFRLEPDGPLGYAGNRQRAVAGRGSPCRKCRTDLGRACQMLLAMSSHAGCCFTQEMRA